MRSEIPQGQKSQNKHNYVKLAQNNAELEHNSIELEQNDAKLAHNFTGLRYSDENKQFTHKP